MVGADNAPHDAWVPLLHDEAHGKILCRALLLLLAGCCGNEKVTLDAAEQVTLDAAEMSR